MVVESRCDERVAGINQGLSFTFSTLSRSKEWTVTSDGTAWRQETATGPGGHPVAFNRASNGRPGLSYVEGGGEFLLGIVSSATAGGRYFYYLQWTGE